MSDSLQRRQLFRVEKYKPTRCPACSKPLTTNSDHGFLFDLNQILTFAGEEDEVGNRLQLGLAVQGRGKGTPVVCSRCHACFTLVVEEIRHYEDSADAALALENEGFVNLQTVQAVGNVPDVWKPPKEGR